MSFTSADFDQLARPCDVIAVHDLLVTAFVRLDFYSLEDLAILRAVLVRGGDDSASMTGILAGLDAYVGQRRDEDRPNGMG